MEGIVKKHCGWCDKYIINSPDYYKRMGNCCTKCSARFSFKAVTSKFSVNTIIKKIQSEVSPTKQSQ